MKKKVNKRAITVGILTAITVSLFASVLVVYGKDQDLKAQKAALMNEVCSQAVVLDDVNTKIQKTIPVVKTLDAVDLVAVAAEDDYEEEYYEEDEYVEEAFYDDYTVRYNTSSPMAGASRLCTYGLGALCLSSMCGFRGLPLLCWC